MTQKECTEIGTLALDMGADTDIASDHKAALSYCAERQDHMEPYQLSIFDMARMDHFVDHAENI